MVKRILSAVIAAFAVGLAAEAQEKNTAELEKRMAVVELSPPSTQALTRILSPDKNIKYLHESD